jgi:hypothetical protein
VAKAMPAAKQGAAHPHDDRGEPGQPDSEPEGGHVQLELLPTEALEPEPRPHEQDREPHVHWQLGGALHRLLGDEEAQQQDGERGEEPDEDEKPDVLQWCRPFLAKNYD